MSCKGVSLGLRELYFDRPTVSYLYTLMFAIVVVACIVVQMNYLNKSLDTFKTPIVATVYYVLFTLFVMIASAILFKELANTSTKDIAGCLCGFATIICALYLIHFYKTDDSGRYSIPSSPSSHSPGSSSSRDTLAQSLEDIYEHGGRRSSLLKLTTPKRGRLSKHRQTGQERNLYNKAENTSTVNDTNQFTIFNLSERNSADKLSQGSYSELEAARSSRALSARSSVNPDSPTRTLNDSDYFSSFSSGKTEHGGKASKTALLAHLSNVLHSNKHKTTRSGRRTRDNHSKMNVSDDDEEALLSANDHF